MKPPLHERSMTATTTQPQAVHTLNARQACCTGCTPCVLCPCVTMGYLSAEHNTNSQRSFDCKTCFFYFLVNDCGAWWAQDDLIHWKYVEDTYDGRCAAFFCFPCIASHAYSQLKEERS